MLHRYLTNGELTSLFYLPLFPAYVYLYYCYLSVCLPACLAGCLVTSIKYI